MKLRAALADAYGLRGAVEVAPLRGPGINNRVWEVRCGGDAYVLKQYQTHSSRDTIQYEHQLLAWLAAQSLPFAVPVPLSMGTGETVWQVAGQHYALFPRLPGQAVWLPSGPELEQVGWALAHLHRVLARYPKTARPGLRGYGDLAHVHPLLPRPEALEIRQLGLPASQPWDDELGWWRAEVERMADFADQEYPALPVQVIHGDYTPSNALFDGEQLTAVLDFDMALPDARAMDVAAGMAFSMRLDDEGDPVARAAAFCKGYGTVRRLAGAEVQALLDLMALRDVVSTIWWLGRGLAAGDVRSEVGRIVKTRQRAAWRAANGGRVIDDCAAWLS